MLAPCRRDERRLDLVARARATGRLPGRAPARPEHHERQGRFLEGTGSVVFDHVGRVAYACLSPRTDAAVLDELCADSVTRRSHSGPPDRDGVRSITPTCCSRSALTSHWCARQPWPPDERDALLERLARDGRRVIVIDHGQLGEFAGNVLELRAADGARVLAASQRAVASLSPQARAALESCVDRIVALPVPTIETLGGGSVRCMLAEVFLPRLPRLDDAQPRRSTGRCLATRVLDHRVPGERPGHATVRARARGTARLHRGRPHVGGDAAPGPRAPVARRPAGRDLRTRRPRRLRPTCITPAPGTWPMAAWCTTWRWR